MSELRGGEFRGMPRRRKLQHEQHQGLPSSDRPIIPTEIRMKFPLPDLPASQEEMRLELLREESRDRDWSSSFVENLELNVSPHRTPSENSIFSRFFYEQEDGVDNFALKEVAHFSILPTEQPEAAEPPDSRVDLWDSPLTRSSKRHPIYLDVIKERDESLELREIAPVHRESAAVNKVESPTGWEKVFDGIATVIAFTVSPDAGLLKVADNAVKYQPSLLAKFTRGVLNVVKWLVVPGSIIIDTAMMIAKETSPPPKVEVQLHETSIERDIRVKNREAFCDFWQSQGLGAVNRFA
ncbi:hypothetical protein [Streptomyces sp. NPDC051572]|uniref:hypothetical protein n=1 Tax=Streptomyces sp. NPDC051572 TaxID=3155802 RepID=UPI00344F7CC4